MYCLRAVIQITGTQSYIKSYIKWIKISIAKAADDFCMATCIQIFGRSLLWQ